MNLTVMMLMCCLAACAAVTIVAVPQAPHQSKELATVSWMPSANWKWQWPTTLFAHPTGPGPLEAALAVVAGEREDPHDDHNEIDTFRSDLCFKRKPLIEHKECMVWFVKECKGKESCKKHPGRKKVCGKVRAYVKKECKAGSEIGCDYARALGMDPSGWKTPPPPEALNGKEKEDEAIDDDDDLDDASDKVMEDAGAAPDDHHDHDHGEDEGSGGTGVDAVDDLFGLDGSSDSKDDKKSHGEHSDSHGAGAGAKEGDHSHEHEKNDGHDDHSHSHGDGHSDSHGDSHSHSDSHGDGHSHSHGDGHSHSHGDGHGKHEESGALSSGAPLALAALMIVFAQL